MSTRHLFLVGYDIGEPSRRHRACREVQGHALGGQKSFYECWLSVSELQTLLARLRTCIDVEADRVIFIRLDSRSQSLHLGRAEAIGRDDFFHIT